MRDNALNQSIDHWQRLKDAVETNDWQAAWDEGWRATGCALCTLYAVPLRRPIRAVPVGNGHYLYVQQFDRGVRVVEHGVRVDKDPPKDACQGCPVASAAHAYCEGTPYKEAATLLDNWVHETGERYNEADRDALRDKTLVAVTAELEFLKSLLIGD